MQWNLSQSLQGISIALRLKRRIIFAEQVRHSAGSYLCGRSSELNLTVFLIVLGSDYSMDFDVQVDLNQTPVLVTYGSYDRDDARGESFLPLHCREM